MATILGLINRAATTRQEFPLSQQPTELRETFPFGDMAAIVALVESQGMSVSNVDSRMAIVNNTAWLTVHGLIKPI